MKKLKEFLISFSGLKEGKHRFNLSAEDTFFDCFDYSEIEHGSVQVNVLLDKHSTFLELEISVKGKIEVMCDRCTDRFFQDIESEGRKVIVKFGEEFLDEGDDLIILPPSENDLDLSGLIYESIVLSIPSRRVHPEGLCNTETLEALENIRVEETTEEEETTDPRWDALKKLK